jgi:hypothetical protein
MPLVKKQSGWFWGSKGPFDSKAKALSVARAAYASGYKGEGNNQFLAKQFKEFNLDENNSLISGKDKSKLD